MDKSKCTRYISIWKLVLEFPCESTLHRSVHRSEFDQHRTLCAAMWRRKFPETVLADALAFLSPPNLLLTPKRRLLVAQAQCFSSPSCSDLPSHSTSSPSLSTVYQSRYPFWRLAGPPAPSPPLQTIRSLPLSQVAWQLWTSSLWPRRSSLRRLFRRLTRASSFRPSGRRTSNKVSDLSPFILHLALTAPVDAISSSGSRRNEADVGHESEKASDHGPKALTKCYGSNSWIAANHHGRADGRRGGRSSPSKGDPLDRPTGVLLFSASFISVSVGRRAEAER